MTQQTPQRIVDIEDGIAMVVTDLHGDWDAYCRYRDHFLKLHRQGEAQRLFFLGDLIHLTGDETYDKSLEIVLDVIELQKELGDKVTCLLGNHELPHIYSITLQKGNDLFTPRFEKRMGYHRQTVISFFDKLPFYIRTKAGVLLCHAGATAALTQSARVKRIAHFSHQALLDEARKLVTEEERPSLMRAMHKLNKKTYNEMVRNYFDVHSKEDPRYDDFLVGTIACGGNPDFSLLWDVLFTRNEHQYGKSYPQILAKMLTAISLPHMPQKFMVSGHINVKKGYKTINNTQLRIASGKHALPPASRKFLLFDTAKPLFHLSELEMGLDSVF